MSLKSVFDYSPVLNEVVAIRESADKQGLLGTRVFVEEGLYVYSERITDRLNVQQFEDYLNRRES